MAKLISLLKKLPIDVGQGEKKHNTAGKRIGFSMAPVTHSGVALDIGCRDGYWSEQLKKKGYTVRSLDIEPQYSGATKHDVEEGLPYEQDSFDVIWCTEVIEHLRNPIFLISEIERVLRPNGIAILTTPNSHWWFYWVVRLWGWSPKKIQNPDHKQFFSERDIRALAKGYDIYGYFPYAVLFLKIIHLIGPLSPTFILVRERKE